tara:strand:- start:370 stop:561 length:192 start_codon:yes stop_codon:yes gene_type:complete
MEKYRWYRNKRKKIHRRKESWFNSAEREKVYEENFIRIKGADDLTPFVKPKPKAKSNAKKNKK